MATHATGPPVNVYMRVRRAVLGSPGHLSWMGNVTIQQSAYAYHSISSKALLVVSVGVERNQH